ncbi:MAG: SDR family oxidoreductase [Rhizobiaceae bacterium]|nr:SDR family oxidoreductase [Rhizobiaceae bacterium]
MSQNLFDLRGRTALVTGSTRGLGRAIAEGLARAGAKTILNGTNERTVGEAVDELRTQGRDVEGLAFDVANEAEIVSAFQEFDARQVNIDILVNNAGIQFRKPIVDLTGSEWQRVIDVNLTSVFLIGREAGRRMVARKYGKIINIGSITSELARPTIAPYGASKGGVKMLTKIMTAEWAKDGVQVNGIGPGFLKTDMNQTLVDDSDFNAWVKSRTPTQRWGSPDDILGTVIYLASPASDFVNGQMIYVDGGLLAVI